MKLEAFVEYEGEQTEFRALEARAKGIWKAGDNKVKDLLSLALYLKPQEKTCYYVFNDKVKGSFTV